MNLVFDSNIYLAAMGLENGFCHKLLTRVIKDRQRYFLYTSTAIVNEISSASRQMKKEGLIGQQDIDLILSMVSSGTFLVHPKEKFHAVPDDKQDNKILECAVEAKALLVVTMDKHLLKLKTFRNVGIVHPKTFLHILGK